MALKKDNIDRRLAAAEVQARGALSLFHQAAAGLESAAASAQSVVDDAEARVQRLISVRDDAKRQVFANQAQAQKIKEFIGE